MPNYLENIRENESDSIHAQIERHSKHIDVYTTGQWAATIRGAKKKSPFYKVTEMEQEDFLDFKSFSTQLINMSKTVKNEVVNFLKIRKYTVFKNNHSFYISYSMDEEALKMNLLKHCRKS